MTDGQASGSRWRVRSHRSHWAAMALVAGLALACSTAAAEFNPRLKAFLDAYHTFKERERRAALRLDVDWLSANGPWAPYLSRPFSDGLDAEDRTRRREAIAVHDCKTIETLARKGFSRLYPDIAPALAATDVAATFRGIVLYSRSPDYVRCRAHETLDKAYTELARGMLRLGPFDANTHRLERGGRKPAIEYSTMWEYGRCSALRSLKMLAVFRDFAPAIRDLLAFSETRGPLILTPEEEYYLLERASHHGLAVPDFESRRAGLRRSMPAKLRAKLDAAAREPKRAPKALPLWHCPLSFALTAPLWSDGSTPR